MTENSREKKLKQIENDILNQVQLSDFYHMMFLKPIQCMLDQSKVGLPRGLKIVNRINDLQYQAKPIQPIQTYKQFSRLRDQQIRVFQNKKSQKQAKRKYTTYLQYCIQNKGDNLLCQMKLGAPVQMAICVCMYNQDREMLNNTLLGIGQNIAKLYKDGVDPDKIVVIILQDGIQKMDTSILQLFEVLEAESGIRFNSEKQRKLEQSIKQIHEIQKTREDYLWDGEDSLINMNCFLFDKQQEEKRKSLRFTNVKKQYDEIKKLYVEVEKLKNDKTVTHEDLPAKVLNIFKEECKKFILGDAGNNDNSQETINRCYNQVAGDLQKSRPLVQNALVKASQYCKQYIESRLEMSHVSFFRTSQFFPDDSGFSTGQLSELKAVKSSQLLKISEQREDERQSLIQNIEERSAIKMNIFFVVKYKNAQKLSSHNWFFNGFCKEFSNLKKSSDDKAKKENKQISPKYTILLDVGLRPEASALCKMYYTLENHNNQIGGVCGYMGLKLERTGKDQQKIKQNVDFFSRICLSFVDIQRAQQLQYHFAHLIDKGFESIFKFIHVLPGAFSGYNMKAIWGDQNKNADELLQNYFKSIGEKVNNKKFSEVNLSFWKILARVLLPNLIVKKCIQPLQKDTETYEQLMYQSNVYLAEDRILCMGIHQNNYDLMFLPDAYSFVDPVKDIPSLMGQRKRWINGSYFAFEKVSDQFSERNCCQVLNIQIWYLSLMNILAFIAPGFFLFSISVAMQAFKADVLVHFFQDLLKEDSPIYNAFVYTINFIYAMLIFGLIFFSMNLTNRNQQFVRFVYGISTILGVMSLIMLSILIVDLVRGLGRESSYLISNQTPTFVDEIPGGQATVDSIRYVVLGIMGLYGLPLLLYSICFCNIRVIFEVIAGALSFVFYTPTYLIILNIYALCRMDDLSWGTKGLDSEGGGKDAAVLNTWKIIRTIHVGKLVFWNVLVAGLLIHFGSNYLIRFYLTFALMIIIASTMLFKVICGILYYFYYLIAIKSNRNQVANKQNSDYKKVSSNKTVNTDSVTKLKPSLYSTLKQQNLSQQGKSLIDQLKNQIRSNIQTLNTLSGGEQTNPNILAMQIVSMVMKKSQNKKDQTIAMGSMISNILSAKQNEMSRSRRLPRKLQPIVSMINKQFTPSNQNKLPNKMSEVKSNSSNGSKEDETLLKGAENFIKGMFQNLDFKDNSPNEKKTKKQQFHTFKGQI